MKAALRLTQGFDTGGAQGAPFFYLPDSQAAGLTGKEYRGKESVLLEISKGLRANSE